MILNLYLQYWISAAILAAANLGVADAVKHDAPRSVDAIARDVGADPACLLRLMRALAAVGIFREQGPRSFIHTSRSAELRSAHDGHELALIRMLGIKSIREAMAELEYAIRTGRSAYEAAHGIANPFDIIASRPDEAAIYHAGMSVDGELISLIVDKCDFSDLRKVVDVGGGKGTLIARILQRCPNTEGVLFDLPEVADRATLEKHGVSDRCEVVTGDFHDGLPGKGDGYIFKNIFHGRSDDDCVRLLRLCREKGAPGVRAFIVENVMTDSPRLDFAKLFDLFLLLGGNGTRVRSEPEFRLILDRAGFTFVRLLPMLQSQCVIEAKSI